MRRLLPALLVGTSLLPVAGQTGRKATRLLEPVKPVEVAEPGAVILSFRHRSGATEVTLKGTKLASAAKGRLKVESKNGYLELDANRGSITGLPRPGSFGADFLTYVLWAVTPSGEAQNLGEILFAEAAPDQTTGIDVTTPHQTFWLMVTAEPHFAVSEPSNVVVLVNQNQDAVVTSNKALPAKGPLIYFTHFDSYNRTPGSPQRGSLELQQARKAVELADNAGILKNPTPPGEEPLPDEKRTREALAAAKEYVLRAETLATQSAPESQKESVQFARTAAQMAEDARALATGAVGQVYIRQLLREIDSAEADIRRLTKLEADQRADIQRLTKLETDQKAEIAQLVARVGEFEKQVAEMTRSRQEAIGKLEQQLADLRSENSKLSSQLTALQAETASLRQDLEKSRAEVARLSGERDRFGQERDRVAQDRDRICTELRKQLAALGSLKSEGGRIVLTLASDILFDFDKFDLRDAAREQLAKLAMLQILIFRDVPAKYVGHTDLVGAEDYNQWLSEQRALRVAQYLLTQRQQLYHDDPKLQEVERQRAVIEKLLAMDAARSKTNATGRTELLAGVANLVEGMGFRSPVVDEKGKNEKNRRVEVVFAETKDSTLTGLCESPPVR